MTIGLATVRRKSIVNIPTRYGEDRDVESVVVNAAELVEVRGDTDMVLTAASYVAQHGFTPFDAIHLVESGDVPIVSSDSTYDELSERICLEE
jgi:hypothetical protein